MNAAFLPIAAVRKAAAYVRMSTDQQTGSIGYQLDYIGRYAAAAGWEVVQIYRDEGRSGLRLSGRRALQQLLADIANGHAEFQAVLVYDVSRWGRFQDVDESGFYEHLCRRSGIAVLYCAEHFANDGSPLSHIMKSVKRTMAAEYSRELSERAVQSHAYFLARGFKAGGIAGYGLRRLCMRANGEPRRILPDGERKGHPTDRVVLVPGPDAEIAVVRRIYRLYLEGYSYRALAQMLNAEGIPYVAGKRWGETLVRQVLTNEKYCGNLLYRRTTGRLGAKRTTVPRAQWLRNDGVIAPLISGVQFEQVQRQHRLRRGLDPEAVLERLRAMLKQYGKLSYRLIDIQRGMPHSELIKKMFGGLHAAYVLALRPLNLKSGGFMRQSLVTALQRDLCNEVYRLIADAGCPVHRVRNTCALRFGDGHTVRVALAGFRCKGETSWGWNVPVQEGTPTEFVICGLLDRTNGKFGEFVLLASADFKQAHVWLSVSPRRAWPVLRTHFLDQLFR